MYGIVLSRHDFRESDQIISILTAEKGKQEYIARGVKKIVSKNTAHLEPCSLVLFGIAEGKQGISYLTNVQPVEQFFSIRASLSKLHIVGYCLDALVSTIKDGEEDSDMYFFVLDFLRFLNATEEVRSLFLDGFFIQLFSRLGYTPILDACVVCKKSYKDIGSEYLRSSQPSVPSTMSQNAIQHLGFYFAGGGIACATCLRTKQTIGEQTLLCGLKEINSLAFLLRSGWNDILTYSLDMEEYGKVHRLIYEFVLYHSEQTWDDWGRLISHD